MPEIQSGFVTALYLFDVAQSIDVSGVMQRLGFDYESLKQRYPRLIYCSIAGYGFDGPLATAPATEIDFRPQPD